MIADRFPVQIEGLKRGLSPTTHAHPRPLSDRDLAILLAIDQYRYIDSDQVAELFDQSRRKAQLCLKDLLWRGLIYRWPPDLQQGSPLTRLSMPSRPQEQDTSRGSATRIRDRSVSVPGVRESRSTT